VLFLHVISALDLLSFITIKGLLIVEDHTQCDFLLPRHHLHIKTVNNKSCVDHQDAIVTNKWQTSWGDKQQMSRW